MRKLVIPLALVLIAYIGLSVYRATRPSSIPAAALACLRTPQRMTLFSLDPDPLARLQQPGAVFFHQFRVLGETPISTPENQRVIANTLDRANRSFGVEYACFNPRHGVRVSGTSGTYDFLICFECAQIEVYAGEQHLKHLIIWESPKALDRILTAAHVPLATK